MANPDRRSSSKSEEEPAEGSDSGPVEWRRIDDLLVWFLRIVVASIATLVVLVYVWGSFTGESGTTEFGIAEIGVLVVTLISLIFLSVYTASSFSRDANQIMRTFREGTDELIRQSQSHWIAQTESLTDAIKSLNSVVELERATLEAAQSALQVSSTMVELERQRDRLAAEQAQSRKLRIRPNPAFSPVILHPGAVAKHIAIQVFNQGEDGRRVELTLVWGGSSPVQSRETCPTLGAYSTYTFDFGDIENWPDQESFLLSIEMDDADGTRYRVEGAFKYDRNRGIVFSDPVFDPAGWQYPSARALQPQAI